MKSILKFIINFHVKLFKVKKKLYNYKPTFCNLIIENNNVIYRINPILNEIQLQDRFLYHFNRLFVVTWDLTQW